MSQFLFHVNNDEGGNALLTILREKFKGTSQSIRLRGRGNRHNGRYQRSLPNNLATRFVVYLEQRPKTKWVKVVNLSKECGYEHILQPTKYHRRFKELMGHA